MKSSQVTVSEAVDLALEAIEVLAIKAVPVYTKWSGVRGYIRRRRVWYHLGRGAAHVEKAEALVRGLRSGGS